MVQANWLSFLEHASPDYIQHAIDVGVDILRILAIILLMQSGRESGHGPRRDLTCHY